MNNTPKSERLHIGIFGATNRGKSTLLNKITGHRVSIVSKEEGTTTDPVYKAMEFHPLGPVTFIDTAGFDDESILGKDREARTMDVILETDIAILLLDTKGENRHWIEVFNRRAIPVIPIISMSDKYDSKELKDYIERISLEIKREPICVSGVTGEGIEKLKEELVKAASFIEKEVTILRGLVDEGDMVLLVMPQDIQAPKGRLILPQVQTIREILDRKAITLCVTGDKVEQGLDSLKFPPKLIITDSQIFAEVEKLKPKESLLTSFSVLFAAYKGDIELLIDGAKKLEKLTANSKILIAEACTHAPLQEDIGRVKLPRLLRKKFGDGIKIDIHAGKGFPENLNDYDLVIHCGACMFNRKYMLSRLEILEEGGIPVTNYGIAIACLKGILDRIIY